MPQRRITIEQARAEAEAEDAWFDAMAQEKARQDECQDMEVHFAGCTKSELVRMWEMQRSLDGKSLTGFEFKALCSAWYSAFNSMPPVAGEGDQADARFGSKGDATRDDGQQPPTEPPSPIVVEERVHSPADVAHITGISVSTLKRMVLDGRLPEPMQLSTRRIGWPAKDVRAILAMMGGTRRDVPKRTGDGTGQSARQGSGGGTAGGRGNGRRDGTVH